MSSSSPLRGSRPQNHTQPNPRPPPQCLAPPGFETFYLKERTNISNTFEAFVLPLHWAIIRSGLRVRSPDGNPGATTIPMSELSEGLPIGWRSKVTATPETGTEQQLRQLELRYWDSTNAGIHYAIKVTEVVKDNVIVVILFRAQTAYGADGKVYAANPMNMTTNSPDRNAIALSFQIGDYINTSGVNRAEEEIKPWYNVYKNLQAFETYVWQQMMVQIGLIVNRNQGQNQRQQEQQQQQQTETPTTSQGPSSQPAPSYPAGGIGGPLYNPPALPGVGGGLGRSDLDPLGRFGAGNTADPRGFRSSPTLPFGGTPGARFDPFGPPAPNPQAPPRPGRGFIPGGDPNPDGDPPPPDSDNMFM